MDEGPLQVSSFICGFFVFWNCAFGSFYTVVVQLSSRRGDTYCHLQDELCQDDGVEDEVLEKARGVWGMLTVAGSG